MAPARARRVDLRAHITAAALAGLPPDEREAVLAHELFHLAHGDVRLVQRLEAVASFVEGQTRSDLVQGFVLSGVRTLSRRRELAADRAAVLLTGRPSALEPAVRRRAASRAAIPDRDLRALGLATFVSEQRYSEARFRNHPTIAERAECIARAATDLGRADLSRPTAQPAWAASCPASRGVPRVGVRRSQVSSST